MHIRVETPLYLSVRFGDEFVRTNPGISARKGPYITLWGKFQVKPVTLITRSAKKGRYDGQRGGPGTSAIKAGTYKVRGVSGMVKRRDVTGVSGGVGLRPGGASVWRGQVCFVGGAEVSIWLDENEGPIIQRRHVCGGTDRLWHSEHGPTRDNGCLQGSWPCQGEHRRGPGGGQGGHFGSRGRGCGP